MKESHSVCYIIQSTTSSSNHVFTRSYTSSLNHPLLLPIFLFIYSSPLHPFFFSSNHPTLHPNIHFFIRQSSYLFIHLPLHPTISLFIQPSTSSSKHPPLHSNIHLFIQTSTSSSVNLPIYSFVSRFIQPSLFSSNHPPLHPIIIHLFIQTSTFLSNRSFCYLTTHLSSTTPIIHLFCTLPVPPPDHPPLPFIILFLSLDHPMIHTSPASI